MRRVHCDAIVVCAKAMCFQEEERGSVYRCDHREQVVDIHKHTKAGDSKV